MKTTTLLCLGLVALSTTALAQQRLQPGLWEHSVSAQNEKINEAMAKAQQQMASMPVSYTHLTLPTSDLV